MVLHRTAAQSGSGVVQNSHSVLRTVSETAALAQIKAQLEAANGRPLTPRRGAGPGGVRTAVAARRRRQALLWRLLAAAAVLAVFTGSSSYRMHAAMQGGVASADDADDRHGWRRWLAGSHSSRRSLRERPLPLLPGQPRLRDPGAQGTQLYEQWWIIGGASPVAQEQQQQDEAIDSSPLAGLLHPRRLQPAALRVFDFAEKKWIGHSLTRFPPELPVARWAVASLLNRAKKKESSVFLVGGLMSTVEAEEIAQAARDKREAEAAANASAGSVQSTDAAAAAAVAAPVEPSCPLASTGVFSLNTGKGKIKTLPPLPAGRYGGVAVVVGARLHFFGGWATPDRASRLAVPAAEHWSIGLNADGSSAPEWQQEAPVPAELRGVAVRALALSSEAAGEPAIYAWASPTAGSSGGLDASASHACAAEADDVGGGSSSSSDGGAKRSGPVALWVFASSTGWQQHGPLPEPVSADFQCAVAASPHLMLAVGGVERAGLFSRQRSIWQYDAHDGGAWSRAGWAPAEFEGHLCALHDGRMFVNSALPAEPDLEDGALDADAAAEDAPATAEQQEAEQQAQAQQQAQQQPEQPQQSEQPQAQQVEPQAAVAAAGEQPQVAAAATQQGEAQEEAPAAGVETGVQPEGAAQQAAVATA